MAKRLVRPKPIYDTQRGRVPVGRTRFYRDFVFRDGGDQYIPGTRVRRLRLVKLGPRARAVDDDEIDRVIQELADEECPQAVCRRDDAD